MITEAMIQAIIAENERLKAVIDEANAQEPVAIARINDGNVDIYGLREVGDQQYLYARPIPAQQSPAASSPDSPAVEHAWERFQAAINNDETEDSRTQFHSWADEKGFCMDEVWSSVGEPFESEDTQLAWEIWQASRDLLLTPSPRITEQDARELGLSAFRHLSQYGGRTVDTWWEESGRALLAKLNGGQ